MKLSHEHQEFRDTLRRYLQAEIEPNIKNWEDEGRMPLQEVFHDMANLGFLGLEYSPEYNGQGVDHLYTLVLAEELGRLSHGSFPMAFGVHVAMATPSLNAHGSHELKMTFLAPAMRGEMVAGVAVTEPDAGSDVAGLKTRAVRDGDDWIISGTKIFITNAAQADWLCVLARTSGDGGYKGMSQIIVPMDTRGIEVRVLDKLGMRASDTGIVSFDRVRVPIKNTVGEIGRGFQQQMGQFVIERMWAAYGVPSSCEIALEKTCEYALQRKIFGVPLAANQYLQYKFAELAAEVDLLRTYNHQLAMAYAQGEDVKRSATIAKLKAGRLDNYVSDWCVQVHGGMGFMEETWTARRFRDTRLLRIGGGADEVMLRVLARMDGFFA